MTAPWVAELLASVVEADALRRAVSLALSEGRPALPLWLALADEAPDQLAALALDAHVPSSADRLDASLAVIDVLESELGPERALLGLWALANTAEERAVVRAQAAARHPSAAWNAQLVDGEASPGTAWLTASEASSSLDVICATCAARGFDAALIAAAAAQRSLHPAVALIRVHRLQAAAAAAAAALDAESRLPVVAWLAAVYGPDLELLLLDIARAVRTMEARDALRRASVDLPSVLAALAAP